MKQGGLAARRPHRLPVPVGMDPGARGMKPGTMALNDTPKLRQLLARANLRSLAALLLILVILSMMALLPPVFLLDGSFTFNIAISVMAMLVAMYRRGCWISSFSHCAVASRCCACRPTSPTRIVLPEGQRRSGRRRQMIEASATSLVGGNTAVGPGVHHPHRDQPRGDH